MANHSGHVHAQVPLEAVQEAAEGAPVPVHTCRQGVGGHALHLDQHGGQVGGVRVVAQGGDAEAAVAHDHAGDSVMGRRRGVRVPEELGVVVGVGVNEAGAHDPVGGINRLDGLGFSQVAHRRDAAVGDGHVGPEPRFARAVDHRATADD